MLKKKQFRYYWVLSWIFFLHLISVIICALQDTTRTKIKYGKQMFTSLNNYSYWLWFFSWWSAWTSLITFFWIIYRLFKKDNPSYFTQVFDLIIVTTNVVSGITFTVGWIIYGATAGKHKLLTNLPKEGLDSLSKININFYFWQATAKNCWITYNLTWHVIAPLLVFYFFWEFGKVNLLVKHLKTTLLTSLVNPTIYFLYVILRPIIDKQNSYLFKPNELDSAIKYEDLAHIFPHDYPWTFFYRCMGKKSGKYDVYYNKYNQTFSSIIWTVLIIFLAYLIFSLLANYLVNLKLKKEGKVLNYRLLSVMDSSHNLTTID